MVIEEVVGKGHDDLQKKHFGQHSNEQGEPVQTKYFGDKADKRHPTTVNKKTKLVK